MAKVSSAMLHNGQANLLANVLMSLSTENVRGIYASVSVAEWEQRIWCVQSPNRTNFQTLIEVVREDRVIKNDLVLTRQERSRSLLYQLIGAISNERGDLDEERLTALFNPYLAHRKAFPILFPIKRSHFHIPENSNTVSCSFRLTIDKFIERIEFVYEDRPYELREGDPLLRSHWVLEATGIFFARSAALFVVYTVDRILQRIGIHSTAMAQRVGMGSSSSANAPAPPTGSPDGANLRTSACDALPGAADILSTPPPRHASRGHPASPLLLLSFYLAKHSARASKVFLARGLLDTLEALFDEPGAPVARGAIGGPTRRTMHQLSHALLVQVSRYFDLDDCTIKQELYDEIVAASRAASARYHDIQWREIFDEELDALRIRRGVTGTKGQ